MVNLTWLGSHLHQNMLLQVFSSFGSSLRSESSVDCLEAAAAALLRDENLRKVEAALTNQLWKLWKKWKQLEA